MAENKKTKKRTSGSASVKSTSNNKKNVKKATASKKTASSSSKPKKKLTVAQRREIERQNRITQLLIIIGSLLVTFIVVIIFVLVMQGKSTTKTDFTASTAGGNNSGISLAEGVYPASKEFKKAPDGEQLKAPAKGEEVAVLETSMGKIKIRLFPEYAPTAVENFKTHIKSGYYNGIIFHRVIDDFMIQSGDPTGTGYSGSCAFEGYESFEDEFDRNLYNFRGALSMANGGSNTNGSQFFIVQTKSAVWGGLGSADSFKQAGGADWAAKEYEKRGGTAYLDGQFKSITGSGHTVFGQVYEGMNVVDKIAAVKTDSHDKPVTDVVIKKAYLETVK